MAKELRKQLDSGYNIEKIAQWAFSIYLKYCGTFECGLQDIIMDIVMAEEGLEFELSKDDLVTIANELER